MGSGGYRYGAGRPGWRGKCEHYLGFDIRKLRSLRPGTSGAYRWTRDGEPSGEVGYSIGPSCITLVYTWTPPHDGQPVDMRLDVPLERTPCHFGGSRPWFRCPSCDRRCAIVYGVNRHGRFGCRSCMDLAYASEAEGLLDRCHRKIRKLEARLDPDYEKPQGMHWRTYERIGDRLTDAQGDLDAKWAAGALRLLAAMQGRVSA